MLAGKTVAVVGDSSARMVYAAILRAVAEDRDAWRLESTEKHRDWAHKLDGGGVAAFVWAPFVQNVTASLPNLFKGHHSGDNVTSASSPSALVMGSALWHELWVNDVDEYAAALKALARRSKLNSSTSHRVPRVPTRWATDTHRTASRSGSPQSEPSRPSLPTSANE